MDKYKISAEEFAKTSIARLASHPNSSTAFGESKMSEADLKSRFDKQGELFRKKFNAFLDIIGAKGDGDSLSGKILTGISEDHTLKALFEDIVSDSGRFASYLSVGDMTLMQKLQDIVDNYVPRVNHGNPQSEVLVEDANGKISSVPHAYSATPNSIARRQKETGALKVGEPVAEDEAVTLGFADKRYIGSSGNQVLDGGLVVKGNLLVEGDGFETSLETLAVKDAVIVSNADGVPLAGLSGYVLRTANGDYGILYDPAEDCVKIGLGVYDGESKVFTFDEGEAQPIATRGKILHGNFPVWNEEKQTLEDGGMSPADIRKTTANALIGEKTDGAVLLDDVAPDQKAISVVSAVDPIQEMGTPAPDNVLSIHPVAKASITRSGRNLVDFAGFMGDGYTVTKNGITATLKDGMLTVSGTNTRTDGYTNVIEFSVSDKNIILPPGTYTVDNRGDPVVDAFIQLKNIKANKLINMFGTFTLDKPLIINQYIVSIKTGCVADRTFPVMLVSGTEAATAYEPYQGETITLDFGREVYGGSINWNTGELMIDRMKHVFDGSEGWTWGDTTSSYTGADSRKRFQCPRHMNVSWMPNRIYSPKDANFVDDKLCCSMFPVISSADTWKNKDGISSVSTSLFIYKEEWTSLTIEEFKTLINGMEVVFGIVNPITIQLTPYQLEALSGDTTVFCDTGKSTVTYNRDINKAFAELQQAIISLGGNV